MDRKSTGGTAVIWLALLLALHGRRVSRRANPVGQPGHRPMRTDDLWRAYQAHSENSGTVWASLIQVVIFSIAGSGVLASGVILSLTSPVVCADGDLAIWLYFLLSNAWGLMVVLCGTYYLLTFGGMLRGGRHARTIECLLIEADPTIDQRSLFEHSPLLSRRSSWAGYVVAAIAALGAAFAPQVFFHTWWSSRVGVDGWPWMAEVIFVLAQLLWLLGYGLSVALSNFPKRCDHNFSR